MTNTWKVTLGTIWRGFKVQGTKAARFVKEGVLSVSDDGALGLSARYDPPGSGWLALAAAIVTGVVVTLIAQATGTCAGPGWLLWYIVIVLMRRKSQAVNLQGSESVVIDSSQRRMAFRTDFEGKQQWIAFELPQNADDTFANVRQIMPSKVTEGKITRRLTGVTILVIVLGVFVLLAIIAAIVFSTIARPPAAGPDMI